VTGTLAQRMRVLYVIDSLIGGGAETSLAHMAPAYEDRGLELHVAFLKARWDVAGALRGAGATLHPVALDQGRARQLVGLVGLIRELRPDVVHTTLWEADVIGRTAAALTGRPAVTTFANSSYSPARFASPAVNAYKLHAAQLVDAVTAHVAVRFQAVSETVASDMARRLLVRRRRIVVVPRARRRDALGEPTPDRRRATRRRLGLTADQPVILAVARHEHHKALDVLVRAVAAIRPHRPDLVALVAGRPGPATDDLTATIAATADGGTIRLLGARTDVPDLITAADVVVVPSRVEGLPGAVLEAMALERPVVASDIPMVREAIGDDAYALVTVDDVAAFADAIDRALGDPARTAAVAARARQRFEARFSPEAVVEGMERIYLEALATTRWRRSSAT
jgi:glycosyltransferase involved in cell wall biosynthesis